jgi:hypothetical protein
MKYYILTSSSSPLGDGTTFGKQIVSDTMPEVLKYAGFLTGILIVVLIAKSFTKG